MPSSEREKFFALLASKAFGEDNLNHDTLFGHLRGDEFTAAEAADYLEVSMPTFRRYIKAGKIKPSSEVGTSHLYPLAALRELKKALKLVK
jgi:excisionase family DNA binding protein